MGPRPIGTPDPKLVVVYDNTKGTERLSKSFTTFTKARQFWYKMFHTGRNPHYLKGSDQ